MNLTAVTISRYSEKWDLDEVPWVNFIKNEDIPILDDGGETIRETGDKATNVKQYHVRQDKILARNYILYLAKKRNAAVDLALQKHPETTDIMMCDTYYVHQTEPLRKLIDDYTILKRTGYTLALGGAVWGIIRTRLKDYFTRQRVEWYDKWGVPDLMFTPYGWKPETGKFVMRFLNPPMEGLFHTSSLSGVAIYPRSIWDKGFRYAVFDDLHGCEHNYLFESAGIPRYTDLNAEFWRSVKYPFTKCLRITLHLGRFLPKSYRKKRLGKLLSSSEFDRISKWKQ